MNEFGDTAMTHEQVDDESTPFYTTATVNFLTELPDHMQDAEWHEQHKLRYRRVLRDQAHSFVEALGMD